MARMGSAGGVGGGPRRGRRPIQDPNKQVSAVASQAPAAMQALPSAPLQAGSGGAASASRQPGASSSWSPERMAAATGKGSPAGAVAGQLKKFPAEMQNADTAQLIAKATGMGSAGQVGRVGPAQTWPAEMEGASQDQLARLVALGNMSQAGAQAQQLGTMEKKMPPGGSGSSASFPPQGTSVSTGAPQQAGGAPGQANPIGGQMYVPNPGTQDPQKELAALPPNLREAVSGGRMSLGGAMGMAAQNRPGYQPGQAWGGGGPAGFNPDGSSGRKPFRGEIVAGTGLRPGEQNGTQDVQRQMLGGPAGFNPDGSSGRKPMQGEYQTMDWRSDRDGGSGGIMGPGARPGQDQLQSYLQAGGNQAPNVRPSAMPPRGGGGAQPQGRWRGPNKGMGQAQTMPGQGDQLGEVRDAMMRYGDAGDMTGKGPAFPGGTAQGPTAADIFRNNPQAQELLRQRMGGGGGFGGW